MTASYDYFLHNWTGQCRVETRFVTEILPSYTEGREERRSSSDRPRRGVSVRWSGLSQADQSRVVYALWRSAGQRTYVPLYPDQQLTTSSSSGGTINVPTTDSRFADGAQVLIVAPDGTKERKTISSFTTSAITLTSALSTTYPAKSKVYPLIFVEVLPTNRYTAATRAQGEVDATFLEVFDSTTLPAMAATSAPGALGSDTSDANTDAPSSTPVLAVSPNYVQPVTGTIERVVDSSRQGLTDILSPRGTRAAFGWEFLYSAFTKAAAGDMLRFFDSRKGRLLPFWCVSPVIDWDLSSIATTHVDITAVGNVADLADSLEYVAVVMKDGTVYIRKVSGVTAGGGNFAIALSAVLPTLSSANVARVAPAHFCRFGKDSLTQEADTDGVSRFTLSIVEILSEAPSTEIELPAALAVGADCEDLSDSCVGPWQVCTVAYTWFPPGVAGDCPNCLLSYRLDTFTIGEGDPCDVDAVVNLAAGAFIDGVWTSGAGGCSGLGTTVPITIFDTHGDYVKVYDDVADHGGVSGTIVYANMFRSAGPAVHCGYPGTVLPDDRVYRPCPSIVIQDDWF